MDKKTPMLWLVQAEPMTRRSITESHDRQPRRSSHLTRHFEALASARG